MKGDKIALNYKCILHLTQHLQAVELSILVEIFLNTFHKHSTHTMLNYCGFRVALYKHFRMVTLNSFSFSE